MYQYEGELGANDSLTLWDGFPFKDNKVGEKHWWEEVQWSFPETDRNSVGEFDQFLHVRKIPETCTWKIISYIDRGWFCEERFKALGSSGTFCGGVGK